MAVHIIFSPPAVHAQEHLRPILGISAPRTRVQRHYGIVAVILAGEQDIQLKLLEILLETGQFQGRLFKELFLLLTHRHFQQAF